MLQNCTMLYYVFSGSLCRRVASYSWRQPWQLLSIPLYLWRLVSCCWWLLRSSTPWVCPAIFVLAFLSFSLRSFSRASRHLTSLLLSPRAQPSLMQPLAPLTPVSIPVWCSRLSICLSFSPSTMLSVLFSNTTTRKRWYSFYHVFSLSKSPRRKEQSGTLTLSFTNFTFVSIVIHLSFHIDVSPPIAAFPIFFFALPSRIVRPW